jgi:hypothetical protein
VQSSRVRCVFNILKSSSLYARLNFFKKPKSFGAKSGEGGWMFHFSNRSILQKIHDTGRLVRWSSVMVENSLVGPKFRPISTHSFT